MASTGTRWMNCSDAYIDSVTINDALGGTVQVSTQLVGSNSEKDNWANHFLQGVQASNTMSFSTFDVAAAEYAITKIGAKVSFGFTLSKATNSDAGSDVVFSGTDSNAVVESVSIPAEHDVESKCEINIAFKSPDGVSSGLTMTGGS